jgi:ankyrin repeat protein
MSSLFGRTLHSPLFPLAAALLVALTCGSPAFCGPIHDAAKTGDLAKIQELLKDNPELVSSKDENGATALHWAATTGHRDVVELLLANKADVDARTYSRKHVDVLLPTSSVEDMQNFNSGMVGREKEGATPLIWATLGGKKEVAELLIAHGADVNARSDDGATPLLRAADANNLALAELLLANKADVNTYDHWANNPLLVAAEAGNHAMVELLVSNHADVNARNSDHATPMRLAKRSKHEETARFLREHGGH